MGGNPAAATAELFANAAVAVISGAGHFPWLDNTATMTAAIGAFLNE